MRMPVRRIGGVFGTDGKEEAFVVYARNENQQAEKSRLTIRDALLRLMTRCPYADISITQICREAQVVRQTYYRNFEFKEDILAFHFDTLFQTYFQTYYRGRSDDTLGQLLSFFNYMRENGALLRLVQENGLFSMLEVTITKNLPRFIGIEQIALVEDERVAPYLTAFIATAMCALLAKWVRNGFAETPSWMAHLAARLMAGLRLESDASQAQ
jgi:AcrR family transcriptional regulator